MSFTFSPRSNRVVAKSSFDHNRVEEPESLIALHGDIAVADYSEHIARTGSNNALSLWDRRCVRDGQAFEFHPVVQTGSLDGFPSRGGFVEFGSQPVPRDFPVYIIAVLPLVVARLWAILGFFQECLPQGVPSQLMPFGSKQTRWWNGRGC